MSLLRRYQLMPQIVRNIILDQAIADISCTEEERRVAVEKFYQQHQLTSPQAQEAWLRTQGMSLEQMEDLAVRPVLLEKFKIATWESKVDAYFLNRKASLDRVVYSLIRNKDQGLTQEIYFRILEGEQCFADLAREYSQGAEASRGGLLGPVPLNQPHPTLSKLLSVSQPGQLWPPRALGEWFVIIRLEEFIPAKLDESMRRHLIDEQFENWLLLQIQQVSVSWSVLPSSSLLAS
nr:peptidylprolyl isomerase [Brasilonema sp. UFV-L1]